MAKNVSNADTYFSEIKNWKTELYALRKIALEAGLQEELKWKQPCYTHDGKNILILGAFKDYCVITFFKGVLLNDPKNILKKPGENSQTAKYFQVRKIEDIVHSESILKKFIQEAIANENAGVKKPKQEIDKLVLCEELQQILQADKELSKAFYALTSGRQRGYNIFFSGAKQSATRTSRILTYSERIKKGIGLHDCTCGLSKKMPNCDGSHKFIN